MYAIKTSLLPQFVLRNIRFFVSFRSFKSRVLLLVLILNLIFLYSLYNKGSNNNEANKRSIKDLATTLPAAKHTDDRLETLDVVKIHKIQKLTDFHEASHCDNLLTHRPNVNLAEPLRWQMVVNGIPETFVFSAYFDARLQPPVVKIIGISSGMYGGPSSSMKYCQLWFADQVLPTVSVAEYNIVPETHDRKYAASFHVCSLNHKKSSIPYAVSLVKEKCQLPNNVMKVVNNELDMKPDQDFTVCVTPLNFQFNNVNQLTEFIEVNRMFGAQKFVFYNHSTGSGVDRYLGMYAKVGLVEVVPWQVPVAVDVWPPDPKEEPEIHYFAQLASLNDCLYRNMFRSRFIVFCDLDEIVVPRSAISWLSMLNSITADWQRAFISNNKKAFPGAYLIQNVFFCTDWPDDNELPVKNAHDLSLITLLKTKRQAKPHSWYIRSKYIVWSRMTSMISVHSVLDFIDDSQIMHVMVSEKHALLHHYRHSLDSQSLDAEAFVDRRMHYFYTEIVNRTAAMHDKMIRSNML